MIVRFLCQGAPFRVECCYTIDSLHYLLPLLAVEIRLMHEMSVTAQHADRMECPMEEKEFHLPDSLRDQVSR